MNPDKQELFAQSAVDFKIETNVCSLDEVMDILGTVQQLYYSGGTVKQLDGDLRQIYSLYGSDYSNSQLAACLGYYFLNRQNCDEVIERWNS